MEIVRRAWYVVMYLPAMLIIAPFLDWYFKDIEWEPEEYRGVYW